MSIPKPDAKQIVQEFLGEVRPVQDTDKLEDDLGADSLDIIEILNFIEDTTGWEFTRDEVKSVYTVGDMQALLDKKYGADVE